MSLSSRIFASVSSSSRSGEREPGRLAREPSEIPVQVAVGDHALRERREDDAADPELAEHVERPGLDPAVQHRVRRLVDHERRLELLQDRPRPSAVACRSTAACTSLKIASSELRRP
jgi:hypothetical protein